MRWLHFVVIGLFALIVIIFLVQNFQGVTMSFLGFSATVPMALLAAVMYLLGMATGGSLLALLRRSIQGARRPTTGAT